MRSKLQVGSWRSGVALRASVSGPAPWSDERQRLGVLGEFASQGIEGIGDDADIAEDGHEVGVAGSAGNDVGVKVTGQARPSAVAQIVSDVKAVGLDRGAKDIHRVTDSGGYFREFSVGEVGKFAHVSRCGDEQMAVGVGKAVHDHERRLPPPKDLVGAVLRRVGPVAAKEAVVVGEFGSKRAVVLHPPRGPEIGVELGHRRRLRDRRRCGKRVEPRTWRRITELDKGAIRPVGSRSVSGEDRT